VQPKSSSAWYTGLSDAPGWSPVNRPLSGKVWRRTTIIHRTIRWCTRLSGEPTVICANGGPCNPRATRGNSNGRQRAPDCPVRQLAQSYNSRLCQKRKKIGTGLSGAPLDRRQVWPSLLASNSSQLPWGYKGTPRRMEELHKHSLSILRHSDSIPAHSFHCVRDLSSIRVEDSLCCHLSSSLLLCAWVCYNLCLVCVAHPNLTLCFLCDQYCKGERLQLVEIPRKREKTIRKKSRDIQVDHWIT
jgi:hypothetical protein